MVVSDLKCGPFIFSSDFDSGNLAAIEENIKEESESVGKTYSETDSCDFEYKLWTSPDACGTPHENGNRTWFYFSIRGSLLSKTIKFNIMNLNKQGKLFSQGMSPVYRISGKSLCWKRIKEKPSFEVVGGDFVLTFYHHFMDVPKYSTVYFAFCFPYSYQECHDHLSELECQYGHCNFADPSDIYFHRDTLCHSNDGLTVDLLTISSCKNIANIFEETLQNLFPDKNKKRSYAFKNKKIFFLSSRVHPGETPASFVFNGFLKFILRKNDQRSAILRDLFVFKLIPMLNPDGVKRGHYRTDAFGVNLNRVYLNPDPVRHPTIYAVKKLMMHYHFCQDVVDKKLEKTFKGACKENFHNKKLDSIALRTAKSDLELFSSFKYNTEDKRDLSLRKSFTVPNISLSKGSQKRYSLNSASESSECNGKYSNPALCRRSFSSNLQINDPVSSLETSVEKPQLKDGNIAIYVDLHGHASKRGCFIYGNYFEKECELVECMLFPKLISLNSSHFDFQACNFSEKNMHHKDKREGLSKEGSGRVAMYKTLDILHSYTLECNYNSGRSTNPIAPATCDNGRATPPPCPGFPPRYTIEHYEEVGRGMAVAALDLFQKNPWSRLPLSEHKSINGVRGWLVKFLRRPGKNIAGFSNKTKNSSTRVTTSAKTKVASVRKISPASKKASQLNRSNCRNKLIMPKHSTYSFSLSSLENSNDANNNVTTLCNDMHQDSKDCETQAKIRTISHPPTGKKSPLIFVQTSTEQHPLKSSVEGASPKFGLVQTKKLKLRLSRVSPQRKLTKISGKSSSSSNPKMLHLSPVKTSQSKISANYHLPSTTPMMNEAERSLDQSLIDSSNGPSLDQSLIDSSNGPHVSIRRKSGFKKNDQNEVKLIKKKIKKSPVAQRWR